MDKETNTHTFFSDKNTQRLEKAKMPIEWKVKKVAELQDISLKARPPVRSDDTRRVWDAD